MFASSHFRPNRPVAPRGIWIAYAPQPAPLPPVPAAIIIYAYPPLASAARNLATDRTYVPNSTNRSQTAKRINRDFTTLCRLVVLPAHRQHNLALRLLLKTLPLVTTPYVEAFTVIARSLSFFKAAGFKMYQPPDTPVRLRVLNCLKAGPLPFACRASISSLAAWLENPPDPASRRTTAALNRWAYEKARAGTSGGPNPDAARVAWLYLNYFNNRPWYALWSSDAQANAS